MSRKEGTGVVVLIGDTYFASNENLQSKGRLSPDGVLFWRWLLSGAVSGESKWNPPAATDANSSNEPDDDDAGTSN
jgi:hypothetical protein